jgi:hypothetical protein
MEEESEPTYRAETRPKLSMTPSWVMLGFVLGAAFVAALPPSNEKSAPVAPAPKPAESARKLPPPLLTTIEAVFAAWGEHAVWDDDVTEVAMWDTDRNRFAEFYEVRRVREKMYFRTIPKLTRRVINHGKPLPLECPLQFTETEERYREWLEHGRTERRNPTGER